MSENLINLASPSVQKELESLSAEAQMFLKQVPVPTIDDKTKLSQVTNALKVRLEESNLTYLDLVKEPDSLVLGTMLFSCQLLLGTDDIERVVFTKEEREQFEIIQKTLEDIQDNKFLLKFFTEVVKTSQFKTTRSKRKEAPLKEIEEEDIPPRARKRTLKK